jgi:hypothetical protein
MRDSSIPPILLALLIAAAPATALAHGHGGGGHHGSGSLGGFAFVPIFAPRIGSPGGLGFVPIFTPGIGPPGAFVPVAPIRRWGPPDPLGGSWGGPGAPPVGIYGWPSPVGVAAPDMTRSEAARESDLDQQIGALPPPPPDAGAAHPGDSSSGEDDSGWQPL